MNSDRELGLSKTLTPSYLAVGRAVLLSTFFSFLFRALHSEHPALRFLLSRSWCEARHVAPSPGPPLGICHAIKVGGSSSSRKPLFSLLLRPPLCLCFACYVGSVAQELEEVFLGGLAGFAVCAGLGAAITRRELVTTSGEGVGCRKATN